MTRRIFEELSHDERRDAPAVVAVCGAPGVGKSALAIRVAHLVRRYFPDGQWYASLRDPDGARRDPADVLGGLMQSQDAESMTLPTGLDARASSFRARLAGRRVLLVLDDAADVAQVQPLLPGMPGCATLVTSRSSMLGLTALYSAQSLVLPPFTPAESMELVTATLGPGRVRREPEQAAELARLCGQLPLALRIAMARLTGQPGRSLSDYVAELKNGDIVSELSMGRDSGISIRDTVDRSYLGLARNVQHLFRLLGLVRARDITVGLAAALSNTSAPKTKRLLDDLVAAGLLEVPDAQRYRLPELIGRYAWEKIHRHAMAKDRTAAIRRLLDFYLAGIAAAAHLLPHSALQRCPAPPPRTVSDHRFDTAGQARGWLAAEYDNVLDTARYAAAHDIDARAAHVITILLGCRPLLIRSASDGPLEASSPPVERVQTAAVQRPAAGSVIVPEVHGKSA
jgi:hypothetical protein